jgi:hypothetical protein
MAAGLRKRGFVSVTRNALIYSIENASTKLVNISRWLSVT